MARVVYLDTETTNLNPGQVCELTCIVEEDYIMQYAKNYFFKVNEMDPGAQSVHGFSIEDLDRLSGGKTFADHKDEIYNMLNGATIVAHNAPFDIKFLSMELWRCGISFIQTEKLDTMEFFKPILKLPAKSLRYGPYKNPKLGEVINYLGIKEDKVKALTSKLFGDNETSYHDSRFDTTAMYVAVNVYRNMLNGGKDWILGYC